MAGPRARGGPAEGRPGADSANVAYLYDGTFEGLLCCVFESYRQRELPAAIYTPDSFQFTLYPVRQVETAPQLAARVRGSIPRKISPEARELVEHAFLSCHPGKELMVLRFLRLGFKNGPRVCRMLQHPDVAAIADVVKHVEHEAHQFWGFLRFSDYEGALAAVIAPKNLVLPLIAPHFIDRYPAESFLIYDKSHGMALFHPAGRPRESRIFPVDGLHLPAPGPEEQAYRRMWLRLYQAVAVPGRENPRCRMSHMPKRYWSCLTELALLEREVTPATWETEGPPKPPAPPIPPPAGHGLPGDGPDGSTDGRGPGMAVRASGCIRQSPCGSSPTQPSTKAGCLKTPLPCARRP